jgi:fatty acid desaturase
MKCNNTEGVEGVRSMKVSVKVKVFCYVLMNFGILGFSAITLLQGAFLQRSLIIYLVSAIWMNLLFWFLFRLRDKGSL